MVKTLVRIPHQPRLTGTGLNIEVTYIKKVETGGRLTRWLATCRLAPLNALWSKKIKWPSPHVIGSPAFKSWHRVLGSPKR